jgi:hypothetical protein
LSQAEFNKKGRRQHIDILTKDFVSDVRELLTF